MKISIILFALMLSGCCTPELIYKDRIVYVPKIVQAEPQIAADVTTPIYELSYLTKNSTNDDIAKAYVITDQQKDNYINRLLISLKPFQPDETPSGD